MEKKEIRIKCTGCQASYKLRVPATDKPVLFKCPKCGKSLKLMIKAAPKSAAIAPPADFAPIERPPGFETTRLTDETDVQDAPGSTPDLKVPSFVDALVGAGTPGQQISAPGRTGMWIFLSADKIRGPFTNEQIRAMIKKREIGPDTSMRRGERPWVAAGKVPDFAHLFKDLAPPPEHADLDSVRPGEREQVGGPLPSVISPKHLQAHFSQILPYPVRGGEWQPLAIFAGIAFVLSAIICFDFMLGLLINVLGWLILYGYLYTLMTRSMDSPETPPPTWNFAAAKEMLTEGAKVFGVLVVFSLLPVAILLTLTIAFFLNDQQMLGLLFLVLTPLVFIASLFVLPAGLVVLAGTGNTGWAVNPSRVMGIVRRGDGPYLTLAVFSIAAGLACMAATVLSVFLVDIQLAGFLLGGFLMAIVFSYGHFIWFHVVGRFAGENRGLLGPVVTAAKA